MIKENYNYNVKCRTCRSTFEVQLFDSHEKNLFLVDKKHWYCDKCKKDFFNKQTAMLTKEHQSIGFQEFTGSEKMISWAVKIRSEMINKVKYLRESLKFENDEAKDLSDKAFELFLSEWQEKTEAKWWIDHRNMNVRDISNRVKEIIESIQNK